MKTREWLKTKKIRVFEWPNQSPDIENLLEEFEFKVHLRKSQNLSNFKVISQQE